MRPGIEVETALERLKENLSPSEIEEVALEEGWGRVLARNLPALFDLPPFDRSPLDGYALRGEDTAGASKERPAVLEVTEEVPAGHWPVREVGPGQASRIFTGAPIPPGANAVVRQEDTRADGCRVEVFASLAPGSNMDRAGTDIVRGAPALPAGRLLTSREIALLGALGYRTVPVCRRPRVALIPTGEELVDIHLPLSPGKIYNSNSPALAAAVREAGGEPLELGIVGDNLAEIVAAFQQGLKVAQLVISTGGVSVGDYDLVPRAYAELGAEIIFAGVNMKPGMPTTAARKDGKLLLGLSGNPAAALVGFELLGRPVIQALAGRRDGKRRRVKATLQADFSKRNPQRRFVRAWAWREEGWQVRPAGLDNPGILSSLVEANALMDLPAGAGPLQAGEQVEVILTG